MSLNPIDKLQTLSGAGTASIGPANVGGAGGVGLLGLIALLSANKKKEEKNKQQNVTSETTNTQGAVNTQGTVGTTTTDNKVSGIVNTQTPVNFKRYYGGALSNGVGQLNTYNNSNNEKYTMNDYISNQKLIIQNAQNNLLASKYGANNFNAGGGYNQGTNVVEGWNDLKEEQGLNAYLKLMQDKQNLDLTANAMKQAESAKNQSYAEQDILRQQAEKYVPNQLRASGLGSVGTSESSRVGIYNQYAKNLNEISKETNNTIQNLMSEYQQAVNEGNANLANQQINLIKEYQDVAYKNAQEILLSANTLENVEQVEEYIKSLENVVSAEQFNTLNILYLIIKRSIEDSESNELTSSNT